MIYCRVECSINFMRIMSTPVQSPYILIRHIGNHIQQFRVFPKKMSPCICSTLSFKSLILPIYSFIHTPAKKTLRVSCQQRIPIRTPNYFYNIPTCSPEFSFKFLYNFPVTSYRPVEPLQIAVNYKNKIVQIFTRCQTNCSQGLWLICFTIT